MGRIDIEARNYLRDNRHFADAFNYYLYDGRQVIDPAALKPLDTAELAIPAFGGKRKPMQGYRDGLNAWSVMEDESGVYVILGAEAQSHIHYAMPVKGALYDAMQYSEQVERQRRDNAGRAAMNSDEFLSGFRKQDRLKPIITLVIYFGDAEWDGPMRLHDMFAPTDPALMRFIPDYRINLIAPALIPEDDFAKFRTDLGRVLEFIKYSRDKEKLQAAVNRDAGYRAMDVDSYELIRLTTHSELKADVKEEKVDMCVALQEMMADSRAEGRVEGRVEGRAEGIVLSLRSLMSNLGFSISQAMDALSIPPEERERYEALVILDNGNYSVPTFERD